MVRGGQETAANPVQRVSSLLGLPVTLGRDECGFGLPTGLFAGSRRTREAVERS